MPSLPVHKGGILHNTSPVTYNYFYETKIKWQFEQWSAGLTPCSLVDEYKYFRRPDRDQLLLAQEWTTFQFRAFPHHYSLPRHCLWPSATHYHYTYIIAHLPAWLFLLNCLTLKMKAPQLFKMFWTQQHIVLSMKTCVFIAEETTASILILHLHNTCNQLLDYGV